MADVRSNGSGVDPLNARQRAATFAVEPLESRQMLTATPWSLQDTLIGLDSETANYPHVNGAGQTVAIIDEGVDYNHYALGNGMGNKIIDAFNFDTGTTDVFPYDNNSHGTGTAGAVAGDGHVVNGQWFQGVAPGAKIVALKANGTWNIKAAFDWVIAHRTQYNIVALNYVNMNGADETQYASEMHQLHDSGVFMAGPVGNYGPSPAYPHLDHLIYNVGSVNLWDQVSSFTPRGPNIDVVAPGEGIIVPWSYNGQHLDLPSQGTSWSGPLVTGTAALIKQVNAGFTPEQILSIIKDSAHWVYDGYSNMSYARLDVNAAVGLAYQRSGTASNTPSHPSVPAVAASVPATTTSTSTPTTTTTTKTAPYRATPAGVSVPNGPFGMKAAAASSASEVLSWYDNSKDETAFIVQRSTSAAGKFRTVATVKATRTTARGTGLRQFTDTGLASGTTYYYRVFAVNAVGSSGNASANAATRSAKRRHAN